MRIEPIESYLNDCQKRETKIRKEMQEKMREEKKRQRLQEKEEKKMLASQQRRNLNQFYTPEYNQTLQYGSQARPQPGKTANETSADQENAG